MERRFSLVDLFNNHLFLFALCVIEIYTSTSFEMEKLPRTAQEWEYRYSKGCSIHEFDTVESASKMTHEQFFALKVIWPQHDSQDLTRKWARYFGSSQNEIRLKASSMRKDDSAWNRYLEALEENIQTPRTWVPGTRIPRDFGPFETAFHNQQEVNFIPLNPGPDTDKVIITPMVERSRIPDPPESPTPGPRWRLRKLVGKKSVQPFPSPRNSEDIVAEDTGYSPASLFQPTPKALQDPPTQDEEIVNRALINFLSAHHIEDERNSDWSSTRKRLVFQSPKQTAGIPTPKEKPKAKSDLPKKSKNKEKDAKLIQFVARTDGYLKVYGPPERSAAILEVKARVRPSIKHNDIAIEMQESAQMALWIFEEPTSHWTAPSKPPALPTGRIRSISKWSP